MLTGSTGSRKNAQLKHKRRPLGVEAFWIWVPDDLPGWHPDFFFGLQQVVDPAYRLPPGLPPGSKAGKNSVPRRHIFCKWENFHIQNKTRRSRSGTPLNNIHASPKNSPN